MEGRKEARKQRKADKQEEATKKGRNTHGNPKHRTGTTNTAMPSPLAGNRKHKTPTGAQHTIPGTSSPNLGTENTPARELKTPWEPPNPPGNRKHHSGKKNTTGTRNTFPGTRNPEPYKKWFEPMPPNFVKLSKI